MNPVRLMMKYLEGQTLPASDIDSLIKALYDEGLKSPGSIPYQAAQELGRDLDSASPVLEAEQPKEEKRKKSPPVST